MHGDLRRERNLVVICWRLLRDPSEKSGRGLAFREETKERLLASIHYIILSTLQFVSSALPTFPLFMYCVKGSADEAKNPSNLSSHPVINRELNRIGLLFRSTVELKYFQLNYGTLTVAGCRLSSTFTRLKRKLLLYRL